MVVLLGLMLPTATSIISLLLATTTDAWMMPGIKKVIAPSCPFSALPGYHHHHHHQHCRSDSLVLLSANRKKRRRKEGEEGPEESSSARTSRGSEADLPDFDLTDGDAPIKASIADPDVITPNMMASSLSSTTSSKAKSLRELIGDRSLEKKLVFDEDVSGISSSSSSSDSSPLPDLVELARKSTGAQQPSSTKRQEQAARKAAAQAAASSKKEEGEEGLNGILSKIPMVTNDKGQVTPIKVIEAATWLGIALLVIWEVYLNSPLFDRAGPMAPVVY